MQTSKLQRNVVNEREKRARNLAPRNVLYHFAMRRLTWSEGSRISLEINSAMLQALARRRHGGVPQA